MYDNECRKAPKEWKLWAWCFLQPEQLLGSYLGIPILAVGLRAWRRI